MHWEISSLCCEPHKNNTLGQFSITDLPTLKARDYQHDSKKRNSWRNPGLCLMVSISAPLKNGKSSRKVNGFPFKQNIRCFKCGQRQKNGYLEKNILQLRYLYVFNLYQPSLLVYWQKKRKGITVGSKLRSSREHLPSWNLVISTH